MLISNYRNVALASSMSTKIFHLEGNVLYFRERLKSFARGLCIEGANLNLTMTCACKKTGNIPLNVLFLLARRPNTSPS